MRSEWPQEWVEIEEDFWEVSDLAARNLVVFEPGPVPFAAFRQELRRGTAEGYIKTLRQWGLVEAENPQAWRRERVYRLTEKGRRFLAFMRGDYNP